MNNRDPKPVSKAEFVWLMTQLGQKDRERYRELRELGWREAISSRTGKSEIPN